MYKYINHISMCVYIYWRQGGGEAGAGQGVFSRPCPPPTFEDKILSLSSSLSPNIAPHPHPCG